MLSWDFISSGMGSSGGFLGVRVGTDTIPMATVRMGWNGTLRREMPGD